MQPLAYHDSASGLVSSSPIQTQPRTSLKFEFIDVEDKDARRKARSHVIREAKLRQKLETLRFQKSKEGSKRSLAPAMSEREDLLTRQPGVKNGTANPAHFLPSINSVIQGLVDPFNHFPVKLSSANDLGLVDHCERPYFLITASWIGY